MKSQNQLIFSLTLIFLILVLFKIYRFELLAYTIDDLSNNLEATYSWILGRPLTYANGLGKTNYTHNYFLTPFLGPITYFFGPIGIFIFYLLLFVLTWKYYFQIFNFKSLASILLFLSIFLNPTILWILDDPGVGWTIELLFLPFTLLFALSLKKQQVNWAVFWAILLVMVREDGIIICCFVQFSFFLFNSTNSVSFWNTLFSKKVILWIIFWFALFVISMTYLHLTAPKDTFFEGAVDSIIRNYSMPDFQSKNLVLFAKALLMLSPMVILLFLLVGFDIQKLLVFICINLVFISINVLQGARYFDEYFFETVSITWVPRFILPFSYSIAFILLVVKKNIFERVKSRSILLLIIVYFVQFPILSFCRKDLSYSSIIKSFINNEPEHPMKYLLVKSDLNLIKKIEKAIPKRSTVFVADYLNPIFLNHFHTWPNRDFEFEAADIAIIPTTGFQHLHNQLGNDLKANYSKICNIGPYDVFATPEYKIILLKNEDLATLIKTQK